MRSVNLKKLVAMSAFGLVALLGVSTEASAQYGRNDQESVYQRQQREANRIAQQQRQTQRIAPREGEQDQCQGEAKPGHHPQSAAAAKLARRREPKAGGQRPGTRRGQHEAVTSRANLQHVAGENRHQGSVGAAEHVVGQRKQ